MAGYFNKPDEKMRTVGLEGLGAFLKGKIPKNAGLDREEIVRLFNRNMAHRGQAANRPEDHQAALDAGKSPVQSQFPRGILDFGTGTPPDTSLPEMFGTARDPDSFDRDDLERNDRMHDNAMRGGDDTLSYTESGDIVIPRKAAEANPALAMAAMKVLEDMGANPAQYVAGSPEGSYNPETGAQEFAWYDDIFKYGSMGLDKIANSTYGQAAMSGLGSAAASKYLFGQDTKTALYTGAGSALGYGVGNYLQKRNNAKANTLDTTDPKYEDLDTNTVMDTQMTGTNSDGESVFGFNDLKTAAGGVYDNLSSKGLKYAGYGAAAGQLLAPIPKKFSPALNIATPTPTRMPAIASMSDFEDQFVQNQRANLSATIPPPAPIAPVVPVAMPQGVTYQDRVRDRDTGEYRYTGASNPSDQSAFGRAVRGTSRRRGLGFGNSIMV